MDSAKKKQHTKNLIELSVSGHNRNPCASRFPGTLINPCKSGDFLVPVQMRRLSGKAETVLDVWKTFGKTSIPLASSLAVQDPDRVRFTVSRKPYKTLPGKKGIPFRSCQATVVW